MCKKMTIFIAACLFTAAAVSADVQINETNFPDPNFRAWLLEQPWGSDGVITDAEIAEITEIAIWNRNISDLAGINFFTNLEVLSADNNQLTSLDLSNLTNLRSFWVRNNQLTSLNVSNLTNLEEFDVRDNQLISLDLTGVDFDVFWVGCICSSSGFFPAGGQTPTLTLTGSNNNYSLAIDLNNPTFGNPALSYANGVLTSTSNAITSSFFSVETGLAFICMCGGEPVPLRLSGTLTLIYETQTTDGILINETNFPDPNFRAWLLEQPWGSDGVITDAEIASITFMNVLNRDIADLTGINFFTNLIDLRIGANRLISLDVSNLTNLTDLRVHYNQLTSIDVSSLTNLTNLWFFDNPLTSLDVSNLTNLTDLSVRGSQLTLLDVSNLTNLEWLNVWNNQLTSLDVSNLTNLTSLDVRNNQLTSLDVSNLTNLEWLNVWNNQLTSIDVSNLTNLTSLVVWDNQLTALDVSNLTSLTNLNVQGNQLTSLDVLNLTNLIELNIAGNQLTSLDVSNLTNLHILQVAVNQLTSLNIANLMNLTHLDIWGNQLTSLNVLNLTNLIELRVGNNQLTSLDISNLTNLKGLDIWGNQFTSLDVSNLTNLIGLGVGNNQLTSLDLTGLDDLIGFSGDNQTPMFTLTGSPAGCNVQIALNNPTNLAYGLSFVDGTLTSTSTAITSSPFSVETGHPTFRLSGTFTLYYDCCGCTDIFAKNFNPNAVFDDGSCEFRTLNGEPIYGCMNPDALNYNPLATTEEGVTCIFYADEHTRIYGCMDPRALNFNPLATHFCPDCKISRCIYACDDNTYTVPCDDYPCDTIGTQPIEDCTWTANSIVSARIIEFYIITDTSLLPGNINCCNSNRPSHYHAVAVWEIVSRRGNGDLVTEIHRAYYCLEDRNPASVVNRPFLVFMSVICRNPFYNEPRSLRTDGQPAVIGFTFSYLAVLRDGNFGVDIPEVEINPNRIPVAFYTITGVRLGQKPQSGIFIILYDDGTAVKAIR